MDNEEIFMDLLEKVNKNTILLSSKFKFIHFDNMGTLTIKNKKYEISPCAYLSINNQIKIKGAGVREIPNDLLVQVYNAIISGDRLKDLKTNIILVDNKVNAIMLKSDDERSYQYISSYEIINTLKQEAHKKDISLEFISGVQDDYFTIIEYKIKNKLNNFCEFGIYIKNSISGYSSIHFNITILYKNKIFPTTIGFVLEHKGDINEKVQIGINSLLKDMTSFDIEEKLKEPISKQYIESLGFSKYELKYIYRHFSGATIRDFLDFCSGFDFKSKIKLI